MWLTSWLRNRTSNHALRGRVSHRPAAARFRPLIEALEDRAVPAQISLTVSSLADAGPGTLRAAILAADAGSHSDKFTIDFSVAGTIDLLSPLPDLNNSIAIQGPGAGSLNVERAAGYSFATAIVTVDAGQNAGLSGLTIANGNAGGIANNGTLTLANSAVVNNHNAIPFGGGGILNFGTLTVSGSTLSGNSAGQGGGIRNEGTLMVSGSTLTGNSTTGVSGDGGGILNAGALTISSSILTGNAAGFGGAIDGVGSASTVSSCTLSGNVALFEGAGLWGDNMTVSGCTFTGNAATGFAVNQFGGAIFGENMTINGCTFTGNSAGSAGGGFYGTGTVSGCTFTGNSALRGGALFTDFATVRDCVLTGNVAIQGGGIYNRHDGTLVIHGCLLSGNSAVEGGGIYNATFVFSNGFTEFGTLTVSGSTLSGNTATYGGGIDNFGTATLQQCTLSGNSAGSEGGGLFNAASGTLVAKDSTVLGNTAPLGGDLYNAGAVTSDDSILGDRYNA
jgi:hypothetical protein